MAKVLREELLVPPDMAASRAGRHCPETICSTALGREDYCAV